MSMMETDSYKLTGRSVVFCLPGDSWRKSGDSFMSQICLWTLMSSMVGWLPVLYQPRKSMSEKTCLNCSSYIL